MAEDIEMALVKIGNRQISFTGASGAGGHKKEGSSNGNHRRDGSSLDPLWFLSWIDQP
jgi:hypothetical protein